MSKKFQTAKARILNIVSPKKDMMNIFFVLMGSSIALFFILALVLGNGTTSNIFFRGGGDFFMDAFNSIRDASQGKEVYERVENGGRQVIYPPMANLLFLVLSRFTNNTYNDSIFGMRESWKVFGSSFIFLMIAFAVCFVALFALVIKVIKRDSLNRKMVFAAMVTISFPILYMLERGNILILCVMSLLIYAFSYNSESKVSREIGLIALAFAFSLKLYPVVFGWFLVADKRYKEAIRCAVYGVAMLIIPSFFFGGPIYVIEHVYENITGWSSGSGNDISQAMQALGVSAGIQSVANVLINFWMFVCAACFAISPFLRRDKAWKTWALGVITILCVPSLTSTYTWAFMLIPLIMLINNESSTRKHITYVVMLTIPFMLLPLKLIPVDSFLQKLIPTLNVSNFSLALTWNYVITAMVAIFIVIDTFVDFGKFLSNRKQKKCIENNTEQVSE